MAFAIVAAVLAVAGAAQQNRAARQQKRANRQQQRIAEAENVRSRRQAIRERLIQQSELAALGGATGTSASSGIQGGIASIGSQTAANLGFASQIEALNQNRLRALNRATSLQNSANVLTTASSIAGSNQFQGLFNQSKQPDTAGFGNPLTPNQ